MPDLVMDDDDSIHPSARRASAKKMRRQHGRFFRWSIRLIAFVILLVFAIAICLQLILWTDLPRRMILSKLQAALGLRVEAPRMTIGWSGHTSLEDVKISLPLAEQSFLSVPRMEVTHTSLPLIMLTQDVAIKEAIFHQPTILLTQDKGGQWNVAEAIDLITRAGGKQQAQDQPAKQVVLPAITVDRGTLQLIDRDGKQSTIQPLHVSGYPSGPLVWKYDAGVDDRLKLTGQVSPGGVWEHEVAFAVGDITPWLAAWTKDLPQFRTGGTWHGKVDGANIDGRVNFDQLSVGTINVTGAASVQRQASGEVTLSPNTLVMQTKNAAASNVSMNSGAIVLSNTSASAKDLVVAVNGGEARINGSYSWGDQSASLNAAWRDIVLPQGVTHEGTIAAKFTQPWPGAPRLESDITSKGKMSTGAWSSHLTVTANGRSWSDIDWTATIAQASLAGQRNGSISDLKIAALMRDHRFTLQSVSLAGQQNLSGNGELNLDDLSWRLQLDGGNVAVHRVADAPFAVRVRAKGIIGGIATLEDLTLESGQIELHASGTYDTAQPKPVSVALVLSHLPPLEGADAQASVRGRIYGKASLSGTLSPVDFRIDQGMLYGTDVAVGNRSIGQLAIQIAGHVTADQASIETTEAQILGGAWRVSADWPEQNQTLLVHVGVRDLPLAEVGNLAQQNVSGTLKGAWTIDIPDFPTVDRTRITAAGSTEIQNVLAGQLQVERVTAQSKYDLGRLVLDPITLQQHDGSADIHVDLAVAHPNTVNVTANVKNWPATMPSGNASAILWAQSDLVVDVAKKSAMGPLKAQLSFAVKNRDAGTLSIDSSIDGRVVNVARLDAAALGGTATGAGVVPIDQPMQSAAKITWDNLDAAQVAAFFPNADNLTGKISGALQVAQSDDPRAVGPLKLSINITPADLRYKTIQIGNGQLTSYFTGTRFVLDESTLHAAGGDIHLWARSTSHDHGVRSSQLQIQFNDLDLDAIDHAFDTKPQPMPGKLQGDFVVVGSIQRRDTLFGEGSVKITQSNLVNLGAIRGLYNIMHIGQDSATNDGNGEISLRLDNSTVTLDNARYFNRGIQARGQVMIRDIWNAPDSPIDGVLIGSVRPLKDIKLPFMADADRILSVVQQGLTPVKLDGTARNLKVVPITFSEVGDTLRKVILGEVQKP